MLIESTSRSRRFHHSDYPHIVVNQDFDDYDFPNSRTRQRVRRNEFPSSAQSDYISYSEDGRLASYGRTSKADRRGRNDYVSSPTGRHMSMERNRLPAKMNRVNPTQSRESNRSPQRRHHYTSSTSAQANQYDRNYSSSETKRSQVPPISTRSAKHRSDNAHRRSGPSRSHKPNEDMTQKDIQQKGKKYEHPSSPRSPHKPRKLQPPEKRPHLRSSPEKKLDQNESTSLRVSGNNRSHRSSPKKHLKKEDSHANHKNRQIESNSSRSKKDQVGAHSTGSRNARHGPVTPRHKSIDVRSPRDESRKVVSSPKKSKDHKEQVDPNRHRKHSNHKMSKPQTSIQNSRPIPPAPADPDEGYESRSVRFLDNHDSSHQLPGNKSNHGLSQSHSNENDTKRRADASPRLSTSEKHNSKSNRVNSTTIGTPQIPSKGKGSDSSSVMTPKGLQNRSNSVPTPNSKKKSRPARPNPVSPRKDKPSRRWRLLGKRQRNPEPATKPIEVSDQHGASLDNDADASEALSILKSFSNEILAMEDEIVAKEESSKEIVAEEEFSKEMVANEEFSKEVVAEENSIDCSSDCSCEESRVEAPSSHPHPTNRKWHLLPWRADHSEDRTRSRSFGFLRKHRTPISSTPNLTKPTQGNGSSEKESPVLRTLQESIPNDASSLKEAIQGNQLSDHESTYSAVESRNEAESVARSTITHRSRRNLAPNPIYPGDRDSLGPMPSTEGSQGMIDSLNNSNNAESRDGSYSEDDLSDNSYGTSESDSFSRHRDHFCLNTSFSGDRSDRKGNSLGKFLEDLCDEVQDIKSSFFDGHFPSSRSQLESETASSGLSSVYGT